MGRPSTRVLVVMLVLGLSPAGLAAQGRTFPEELPDEAQSGPRFDPARARRAVSAASVDGARPEASDPQVPVAFAFHFGIGYAMPSSIDRALRTHFYGDPVNDGGVLVTGDFQLTYRVLEWVWLGGRLGFRGRGWGRDGAAGAHAGGFDLLALVHLRSQVGRVFSLGAMLGGGGGAAGLLLNDAISVGASPRITGGVEIGFRLGTGIRLEIRGSWDYFPWFDIDRFGHDIDLGGPTVAAGLEVRS